MTTTRHNKCKSSTRSKRKEEVVSHVIIIIQAIYSLVVNIIICPNDPSVRTSKRPMHIIEYLWRMYSCPQLRLVLQNSKLFFSLKNIINGNIYNNCTHLYHICYRSNFDIFRRQKSIIIRNCLLYHILIDYISFLNC